ncbi:hypothetical protein FG167_02000 [Lacinutrix sp. WUR7]|uniref:hypothetical protein n=1 Tax=Lacinutrix sp. WUR7 TaxID=2653681 RepID=UPI00193D6024|nr:hypothetical protein [Lacinutrix sp. WUR7]QRM88045.1 hypothetical protein FG167_02000 [Lacinutrix sp. WUR7]
MKTKIILLLSIIMFSSNFTNAQTNINNYKYVIVPNTFDFLDKADEYRLNTLTKLLLEKYGFITIMEDATLPDEVILNPCLALKANVLNSSGLFYSKLRVQLEDCKNSIVFTTAVGESKDKNYQVAYTLALRQAFKSFDSFTYKYKESPSILAFGKTPEKESKAEIEKLKEEIKTLKEEKVAEVEVAQVIEEKEIVTANQVKKELEIKEVVQEEVVQKVAVKEPVIVKTETNSLHILYAQKVVNGFQLVDNTPKVVYKIKETGMSNVFIVEGKNAIIYKLDATWILEYYENEKLQTKILNIKF